MPRNVSRRTRRPLQLQLLFYTACVFLDRVVGVAVGQDNLPLTGGSTNRPLLRPQVAEH